MTQYHKERILNLSVKENDSIKATMQAIDNGALGIAIIVSDEGKFTGLLTDGDIRRAILQGVQIEKPVKEIVNTDPIVVRGEVTEEELLSLQNRELIKTKLAVGYSFKVPVLDSESRVIDIIFLYQTGKMPSFLSEYGPRDMGAVQRVLVIGCAGYLGSILTRKLISRGYLVNGLDNLMYGDRSIRDLYKDDNFNYIQGDIRDVKVLMDSIKDCDAVVHLAAIVGDPACQLDAEETITINYLACKMATEVCKYSQINRYIFASTCSVYGASDKPDTSLTEESSLNPVSLYAETKLKSEQGILEAMDENFSPTIFRMATLYGLSPRMRFDLVINLFAAQASTEGKISIFGGNQWRPFLHVDDAAEAYIRCLEVPLETVRGQIFNTGSDKENYRISDVAEILSGIIKNVQIDNQTTMVDERNYKVSFDRISSVLGYETQKTVRDGILEIKEALENGTIKNYKDKIYSNYESLNPAL